MPKLLAGLIRYVYCSSGGCVISKKMSLPYSYSLVSTKLVSPFTTKTLQAQVVNIINLLTVQLLCKIYLQYTLKTIKTHSRTVFTIKTTLRIEIIVTSQIKHQHLVK
jgi:hypothetical protein